VPTKIQSLRKSAFLRQHGRCCYCTVPMWLKAPSELQVPTPSFNAAKRLRCTVEHLRARSDGGSDRPENIAAACAHCNRTRHTRKQPPPPAAFATAVRKRVAARRWHHAWVYDLGLL
jgi:5-methylcytosine-specific restriction endonuclease McrA